MNIDQVLREMARMQSLIETQARTIRRLENRLGQFPARWPKSVTPPSGIVVGKLNEDLLHGGDAAFSVWDIDPAGGLDADTTNDETIIDPEIIGTGMKLASGVVVIGARHQGAIVLISYGACPVEV